MGNPSNTPSLSVKQDQRDAVSNQGGTQKMGWSAGNEQTTGGRGYAKAIGQEEKPERHVCTSLDKGGKEKMCLLVSLLANWSRLKRVQCGLGVG